MRYGLLLAIPLISQILFSQAQEEGRFRSVENAPVHIRDLLSPEELWKAIGSGDDRGFKIDFGGQTFRINNKLIRGRRLKGTISYGLRVKEDGESKVVGVGTRDIVSGRAFLSLDSVTTHFPRVSRTSPSRGVVEISISLEYGRGRKKHSLGTYSTSLRFMKNGAEFAKYPVITEGPNVLKTAQNAEDRYFVTFRTNLPVLGEVRLDDGRLFISRAGTVDHRIRLNGLETGATYGYRVFLHGHPVSPRLNFSTSSTQLSAAKKPVRVSSSPMN